MIGLSLINHMLEKDVEILAILRENSSKIGLLPNNYKIKIVQCNLEDLHFLSLENSDYDVFYNLAWDGTFGNTRNDVDIQNLNIKYTLDAVRFAKKIGCKKFIGVGSQAEYGRVENTIFPNTPTNPETAYGNAKLCAGNLSRILCNQLGIEHIWARVFSIFGPYDNKNTMIMSSIREMIAGNSLDYTKAEQLWDYLYVGDAAKALYLLGEKGKTNEIYCIGSGKQQPLYKYIEEIKNQINPNIILKLGTKDYAPNQVMNLCAGITNLVEDTGFTPEVSFEEGIKRTIKWYKGE